MTDEAFPSGLLKALRKSIADFLGAAIPDSVEIEVLGETPGKVCIVLSALRTTSIGVGELEGVAAKIDCIADCWAGMPSNLLICERAVPPTRDDDSHCC